MLKIQKLTLLIMSIYLDGIDVSKDIRDDIINKNVSYIAMIPEIRKIIVNIQRKIAKNKMLLLMVEI